MGEDTSNAIVDTSSNVEATITGAASEEIGEIVEVAETLEMVPKTMASPGVDTTLDETGSSNNSSSSQKIECRSLWL